MLSVKHKPKTTLALSADQITQIAGNAATHDHRGNLTAYEINGKDYSLEYDLDNRITKVTVDNDEVEYRYDAFGRRIIRQEGSKFKLQWYHKNYLDHVYAVSDKSGNILEHYRYTAFGEVTIYNDNGQLLNTSAIDNTILWNTRRKDEVSGYYMYKYRHYAPELGRWPSRDPIEESGGQSLYAFVGNDSLSRWDKLGLADTTKAIGKPTEKFWMIVPRERESIKIESETRNGCCFNVEYTIKEKTEYTVYKVYQTYLTSSNWDEIGSAIALAGGAIGLYGGIATAGGAAIAGGVISLVGGGIAYLSPEDVWYDSRIGNKIRQTQGWVEVSRTENSASLIKKSEC